MRGAIIQFVFKGARLRVPIGSRKNSSYDGKQKNPNYKEENKQ
jgi:hypothetical protein